MSSEMSSAPREPISLVRWLPTKPSQEQIVLLITIALLIVFSLTLPASRASPICSTWCAASPFSAFSVLAWA